MYFVVDLTQLFVLVVGTSLNILLGYFLPFRLFSRRKILNKLYYVAPEINPDKLVYKEKMNYHEPFLALLVFLSSIAIIAILNFIFIISNFGLVSFFVSLGFILVAWVLIPMVLDIVSKRKANKWNNNAFKWTLVKLFWLVAIILLEVYMIAGFARFEFLGLNISRLYPTFFSMTLGLGELILLTIVDYGTYIVIRRLIENSLFQKEWIDKVRVEVVTDKMTLSGSIIDINKFLVVKDANGKIWPVNWRQVQELLLVR